MDSSHLFPLLAVPLSALGNILQMLIPVFMSSVLNCVTLLKDMLFSASSYDYDGSLYLQDFVSQWKVRP